MGTITVQVFGQGAESGVKSGLDIAPKPTDHRERRLVLGLPRRGAFGNLSTKKGTLFSNSHNVLYIPEGANALLSGWSLRKITRSQKSLHPRKVQMR